MAILVVIVFAIGGAVLCGLLSYGLTLMALKGWESQRAMWRLGAEKGPQAARPGVERMLRREAKLGPLLEWFLVWWFRILGPVFGGLIGGWVGAHVGGLA